MIRGALAMWMLLGSVNAEAGKGGEVRKGLDRGPSANAGDIPALADLLRRTGWEPTPELSGAFRAGYVFQVTEMGHRLQLQDCFEVQPSVSTYTSAEVVTQLQAGVSVNAGMASVSASGSLVKKVKFSTPEHIALPRLKMVPTAACRATLEGAASSGVDLSSMYVVQEVLTAQIAEQTCGRLDASGGFVGLGSAELALAMACAQESLEPVAIAFRTTPVSDLIGVVLVPRPAPVRTPGPPPRPAPEKIEKAEKIEKVETVEEPKPRSRGKDGDSDGIADADDICPNDPEDQDGFEDSDGCPEPDNDQDGVSDVDDRCPNQPEDRDNWEDEDGCPDPDNDRDGLSDMEDHCPMEAEVINGFEDDDGCPDEVPKAARSADAIERDLKRHLPLFFDTGKATIKAQSLGSIQEIAAILLADGPLKVEVGAHTDNVGSSDANRRLTEGRAGSVRDALIAAGVPADWVVAMGYGPDRPILPNDTAENRALNRRVEFRIWER